MPAIFQSILSHGHDDVLPVITLRIGHPPRSLTAFDDCFLARMSGESRANGRWDNRPCRGHEEQSCNDVHATCARVLKKDMTAVSNFLKAQTFNQKQPPCKPPPPPKEGAGGAAGGLAGDVAGAAAGGALPGGPKQKCNARLEDYPYGLMNPEAVKDEEQGIHHLLGIKKSVFANPASTVWGLIVHGLSGTFGFDNQGAHATDYIYKIKQPNGIAPDYYLCDSRTHPQRCALLGGNMAHNCAEWYDPRMCNYCQDHGAMLTCQVRGWNSKFFEWVRVPIYPRDVLGEMYRGEFRDVAARPMWATISFPKELLRNEAKDIPDYMVQDSEPMQIELKYDNGPAQPQNALLAMATGSAAPDPRLISMLPKYENFTSSERCGETIHQRRRCAAVHDFL